MSYIAKIFKIIIGFIYPNICEICNRKINNENYICDECISNILQKNSGKTRNSTGNYDIIYLAKYKDIKRYIINYKFNSKKYIGKMFIKLFISRIDLLKLKFDYVISVPLSKEKKKIRGYNQSEYIAKKVAENYNKQFVDLLYKNRNNVNQSSLGKEERKENIKGIFSLNKFVKEDLENKNILLIDDVYTTGATIDECIKIIKEKINCNIIVGIIAMNNNKI